ncbi:alpha/beta hydrolase [Arthrobacter frigidicola]|nr:alpha/beta hydrolase [Arthrobacter frigidicola]
MPSSDIAVNGTVLHVEDTGEADLPAILCLHSLFLDGTMFDGLVEEAGGRFRVIRPDFRGQGRSASDNSSLIDLETCADDMAALLDTLDLGDCYLAAQSMGGDVGFRLAARRPAAFLAMAVMGSSARAEPADQLKDFREWVNNVGEHGFTGETLETTMKIMFGTSTLADPSKAAMLTHWRNKIAAVPPTLRPAMAGVIERGSALELLPNITIPVLVFSGAEDLPRPPAWSDEMVDRLPNAELVRLDKIGHSNILEAPDVVIPRVLDFFSTH